MKNEKLASKPNNITFEIIEAVKQAAISCYGIGGICNKGSLRHPDLSKKGKEDAIFVKKDLKGFEIDVYVILTEGVKITEALTETQKVIKFNLDKKFPHQIVCVNVYGETISSN